jgi:hypothetical protein
LDNLLGKATISIVGATTADLMSAISCLRLAVGYHRRGH